MARPVDTPELARKREREAQMVSQMIALWCRGHHGGGHAVEQAGDDEPVRVKLGLRTITLCPRSIPRFQLDQYRFLSFKNRKLSKSIP